VIALDLFFDNTVECIRQRDALLCSKAKGRTCVILVVLSLCDTLSPPRLLKHTSCAKAPLSLDTLPDRVTHTLWLHKVVVVRAEAVGSHAEHMGPWTVTAKVSTPTVEAADVGGAEVERVVRVEGATAATGRVHDRKWGHRQENGNPCIGH
jgi:hypothetical protein